MMSWQVPPGMLRTQTLTIDEDAHADPLEGGVEFVHGMLVQHEGEKTEAKAVAQVGRGSPSEGCGFLCGLRTHRP